jgi:hypothetical protein
MLDAITAQLVRGNANQIQSDSATTNANNVSNLVSQSKAGGINPDTIGAVLANPMASPEQRELAVKLMTPERVSDLYERPGYASPATGVQAAPINGQFQPGVRTPSAVSKDGISGTTFTAAPQPGGQPQSNTPVISGDNLGPAMGTMSRLGLNSARTGAVADFAKADLGAANDAPTIKRVAGVMLDDLHAHGDQMSFGPTAEWSNNIKRIAANYAPGLMKSQLGALAAADSFDKMSAQLTGLLSRSGGTDAQLFNNLRSVPGAHNSKEGAEALLKMTLQVADQQQALTQFTSVAQTPDQYLALKNQFYANNPIMNTASGNPIRLDLQGQNGSNGGGIGRSRIIKVHE